MIVLSTERLASPTSYALMIVGAGLGLSLFFSYSVYKELFSFSRQVILFVSAQFLGYLKLVLTVVGTFHSHPNPHGYLVGFG